MESNAKRGIVLITLAVTIFIGVFVFVTKAIHENTIQELEVLQEVVTINLSDYNDLQVNLHPVISASEEESSVKSGVKIHFTDDELTMIHRMVEAEATGGTIESRTHVANVIINRVLSDDFPNTVKKVLFQKRQFSPVADGRYYSVKVTDSTIKAVYTANNNPDTTHGSTFFMVRRYSDRSNVTWFDKNLEFVFEDELGHEFFR